MACTKQPYSSRQDAKRSAEKISGVRMRPYQCPVCCQWHLTSMSKSEVRTSRKKTRLRKLKQCHRSVEEREKIEQEKKKRAPIGIVSKKKNNHKH